MDKTSLYVYLSSKENFDEYPANKHNAYTNSLRPGLFLDGEYEVSLANTIFKPDIISIRGGDEHY